MNYKLALNVLGLAIFTAMFWLTTRRGATDPVCRMKVDRAKAVAREFAGETYYFCSEHCLHAFETGTATPHHHDHEGKAAHAH
jgi:YHS domain-containing protein